MIDACKDLIDRYGISWLFDAKAGRQGTLMRSVIGDRDVGVQDIHCFEAQTGIYIRVPNVHFFNNIGTGNFTVGLFLSLPEGSDDGTKHTIFSKKDEFDLYEQNGHLYFNIGTGAVTVDTSASGVNFCDGETYLVIAYRDARRSTIKLGIDVYDVYKVQIDISEVLLITENNLHIGVKEALEGVEDALYAGTKLQGVFYCRGNILEMWEKQGIWFNGRIPVNDVIVYQLDENVGEICFDASMYGNHGLILNYDISCRGTISKGFSWQNRYGYSTGAFAISEGVDDVLIDGTLYAINSAALIPCDNNSSVQDVLTGTIEYVGRVRYNVELVDMTCFIGNGATYGICQHQESLLIEPGAEEFSILLIFEKVAGVGGTLLGSTNFDIGINSAANELLVDIGGESTVVDIQEGFNWVVLNVGLLECDVYVDNVLGETFTIGNNTGSELLLFSDGVDILGASAVVLMAVRDGVMLTAEMNAFFDDKVLPSSLLACWFPCEKGDYLIDISGKDCHVTLEDYNVDVWEGLQSELPYLAGGYVRLVASLQEMDDFRIVPFTVDGGRIDRNEFGPQQIAIRHNYTGGHTMFDCWIDMNPGDKELGFYSRFWDKLNTDVWGSLNVEYLKADSYWWHINELTQEYLEGALNEAYYRYVFSDRRFDKREMLVEVLDLILMNTGNDITPRHLPA